MIRSHSILTNAGTPAQGGKMLNLYQRRALIVVAFFALQTASEKSALASDPERDSLWDVLLRAPEPKPDIPGQNPFSPSPRQALGPVPGFSLPAPEKTASYDSVFSKRKKRGSPFGSVGDWFNSLEKATGSKITASGNSTFQLRADSVSGSSDSFTNEQYYGRGANGFYNDTDVSVDATLFKYFRYQTRLSNSLFHNPNDNRVKLDYKTKTSHIEWGDLNAGFQGNSLIDFNRYLHGIQATNIWSKNLKTTLLWSQIKAETKTIVVNGNNSSGPYYVYSGQIVEGSDHVRIDNGAELIKGKDYQLDPFSGALKFLNNRIITQSSTIAISYEALGFNQSMGTILGGRADYNLRNGFNVGVTYVTQRSKGTSGNGLRTEEAYGFGQQTFYPTDYPIDLTKPLFVYVDGRLLGTDEFTVDRTQTYTNRVFIKLSVLSTSRVKFEYYPYSSSLVPGDRSILGLDARMSLGKLGSVTLDTALSGLNLTGSNINGQAWSFRADLTPFSKFHTSIGVKNIAPTFSSIQSPGFNRNEKSIDFTSDYAPTNRLRFNLNYQIAKRPSYSGSQFSVSNVGNDDYRQLGFGANYNLAKNATLNFNHSALGTTFIQGGKSKNDSDTVSLNYALRSVSFEAALSNTRSNSSTTLGQLGVATGTTAGSQLYSSDTSTFSKRFSLGWQPAQWLHLNGSISDNNNTNNSLSSNQKSNSKESSFAEQLNVIKNMRISYNYSLSDTGTFGANSTTGVIGTTGTSGGTAVGTTRSIFEAFSRQTIGTTGTGSTTSSFATTFLNSGAGGGSNSGLGASGSYSGYQGANPNNYTSFGGKNSQHSLHMEYQPKQNLLVGIQYDLGSSLGDYQYNSDRNTTGFNISWQASSEMQFTAAYTAQKVIYTNGFGGTDSKNIFLSLDGHPFGRRNGFLGKLGMRINWSLVKTASAFKSSSAATGTTAGTSGTDTTTGNSVLTDTSTNLTSLGLRFDYPLSSRQSIFVETLNSATSGFQGNTEQDLKFGLDYALTRALKFSLGWQVLSHKYSDTTNIRSNYTASSLLAEFGFHF